MNTSSKAVVTKNINLTVSQQMSQANSKIKVKMGSNQRNPSIHSANGNLNQALQAQSAGVSAGGTPLGSKTQSQGMFSNLGQYLNNMRQQQKQLGTSNSMQRTL